MNGKKEIIHELSNGKKILVAELEGTPWFYATDVLKAVSIEFFCLDHTWISGQEVKRIKTEKGEGLFVSIEGLLCMVPPIDFAFPARQMIAELIGTFYNKANRKSRVATGDRCDKFSAARQLK